MPVFHFLPGISHRTGGVYIHGEKMQEVSKGGCAAFGSGFPIGARSTLLAHDFPSESLVCYTFCSADAKQMLWHGKGADDSVQRSASEYRLTLFRDSRTGGFWFPITKYRFASCKICPSVDPLSHFSARIFPLTLPCARSDGNTPLFPE